MELVYFLASPGILDGQARKSAIQAHFGTPAADGPLGRTILSWGVALVLVRLQPEQGKSRHTRSQKDVALAPRGTATTSDQRAPGRHVTCDAQAQCPMARSQLTRSIKLVPIAFWGAVHRNKEWG